MCLENVNLKANFYTAPKFACDIPEDGVWIASDYDYYEFEGYTNMIKSSCKILTGLSQLRIIVPDYTRAGTDGSIRFEFNFGAGKKICSTRVLNNKGNDLATNSDNLYQANNLGTCVDITLTDEDFNRNADDHREVEVEAINEGFDGLSMTGVEFYANVDEESVLFTCRLPPMGNTKHTTYLLIYIP